MPGLTIGLFDSGVGGLSVLRRMLEAPEAPWSEIIYLADMAHFPYGPRPAAEVRHLALAGVDLLASLGATIVAVACNTAASTGVRSGLRDTASPLLDIIGPGAREVATIAAASPGSRVIILGTEGTIRSRVWENAIREAGHEGAVLGWPCPFLASLIEEGRSGRSARAAVLQATRGLRRVAADQRRSDGTNGQESTPAEIAVLGCTHYPIVAPILAEVLSREVLRRPVRVVDPAGALVSELVRILSPEPGREGMPPPTGEKRIGVTFLTTGRAEHFAGRCRQLLSTRGNHHGLELRLERVREVSLPAPRV